MRDRVFFLGIAVVGTLALSPSMAFSQAQATSTRIPQQIVINGQMASGAYVTAPGGQMQSYTCPSPQQYTTADGNSHGWACYEQTTGVWLLNAVPPPQAPQAPVVPQGPVAVPQTSAPQTSAPPFVVFPREAPVVVYQAPPPTVIYQAPPTVIYQQAPAVVYAPPPPPPVVVAPAYPSSVILGKAAIDAAGRIASAVILNSRYPREYIAYNTYEIGRHGRR